uniref:DUF805 domain-containing protein n=1 Tax=Steinernema glaseri TaxID=37863 RepID=A0A1I7Z0K4_9BILA
MGTLNKLHSENATFWRDLMQ